MYVGVVKGLIRAFRGISCLRIQLGKGCPAHQLPPQRDVHVTCRVRGFLDTVRCFACGFTMIENLCDVVSG